MPDGFNVVRFWGIKITERVVGAVEQFLFFGEPTHEALHAPNETVVELGLVPLKLVEEGGRIVYPDLRIGVLEASLKMIKGSLDQELVAED